MKSFRCIAARKAFYYIIITTLQLRLCFSAKGTVRANVVIEDVLARKAISNAIANVLAIVEKFARTEIHNS